MARPKSWFGHNQLTDAAASASERGLRVYQYIKKNRNGSQTSGYYVGRLGKNYGIPVRLRMPCVKIRWVRPPRGK